MHTIIATTPCAQPPAWAFMQRRLFDAQRAAAQVYLDKYTRDDGALIWGDVWTNGRDGADDLYEAFVNWPLLYLLGGDDWFLETAQHEWDAITRQLTALGPVLDEYERGYDQFHQSEHYTYFYFLCLAEPGNPVNRQRARRFADLYVRAKHRHQAHQDADTEPGALPLPEPNYDLTHKLIRAPHNGSGGPRWGFFDHDDHEWSYAPWMRPYGLPFDDVPGVTTLEDLKDPALARRMGAALQERYGKGDVAANLGVVSLIANAWLLTGEARYRDWIVEYVGTWLERARANSGLVPDNVGLSGQVGEYLAGKWFGGLYGWQWPHGYYNLGMATTVAAAAAFLVSGDAATLDLPRNALDHVWSLRRCVPIGEVRETSLWHHWTGQTMATGEADMLVAPYRHGDGGWFDFQPLSPIFPAALWNLTHSDEDRERMARLRAEETYDWRAVINFRGKEDAGHEQPWWAFLAGDNPSYPEAILQVALAQVARRMALIEADQADLTKVNIHHWQQLNPVTCEALVQLTLGAPQPIYNGGLLIAPLRYFDAARGRPGLPPDVAALVEKVEASRLVVRLVNLSVTETREVILQAGTFGEHRWDEVAYDARISEYPGMQTAYAAPPLVTNEVNAQINASQFKVVLPPLHDIQLDLTMTRYAHQPRYAVPYDDLYEVDT
jgi:hypothetical protein